MADETTKDELYAEAQALNIDGRSAMDKDELAAAIEEAKLPVEEAPVEAAPVEATVEEAPMEEEPAAEVVELEEVEEAPVISEGPTTQGGSTFLTDRSQ